MIDFVGSITEDGLRDCDPATLAKIKSAALVRCRDCQYFEEDYKNSSYLTYCHKLHLKNKFFGEDFCSRGDRRNI